MKKFTLTGEIGWALDTYDVKQMLSEAAGADILIDFASPGGLVSPGLEMYSLIRNYPGHVTVNLIGQAASMGSFIPLAADRVTAEPTVVYMIHNARSAIYGDHNALKKRAQITEGLSKLMRAVYVAKTGKTDKEIEKMMDDETFLFGQEVLDAGFIDELNGDSDPEARETAIAAANAAFEACWEKVKKEKTDDFEQVAALLPSADIKRPTVTGEKREPKQEKIMDLTELKAKHPEIYAAAVADGVAKERDRASAHILWAEASGDTKTAFEAVQAGTEMTESIRAKYAIAAQNKKDVDDRTADDTITSKAADNLADEGDDGDAVVNAVADHFGVDLSK